MTAEEWTDVVAEKYEDRSGGIELDDGIKYLIEDVVKAAVAEAENRIAKKIEDNADDGCVCCERIAADIRKGVKP